MSRPGNFGALSRLQMTENRMETKMEPFLIVERQGIIPPS